MDKELFDFLHEFKNDINKRFDQMDGRFDKIEGRLDRIEFEMKETKKELFYVKTIAQEQVIRLERIEKVISGIGHQFEQDTSERVGIKEDLKALEKRVEDLEKRADH
ncbi:hypothetical protein MM326_18565 [Alkalihalobacillus sp. LMS6]|uniref:hypothetical protein n=1 Tax=Alkalihalobacillus sp. LMS6 TaxID=2924034 RepID=UPI0020D117A6|nr:hypothetical protein [Alkalihalobacillus sp. LMS6]UTR06057.1 hypothetical protein MM326_18565 [Alkalihalobacillus sp. LMS6]